MIKNILIVGTGGAIGSVLRYIISIYTAKHYTGIFPLSTFLINLAGCFLIGLFVGLAERYQFINADARLFLITGFCGGFTTFSAFSLENNYLMQHNQITLFIYIGLSVILGILGVMLGGFISRIEL